MSTPACKVNLIANGTHGRHPKRFSGPEGFEQKRLLPSQMVFAPRETIMDGNWRRCFGSPPFCRHSPQECTRMQFYRKSKELVRQAYPCIILGEHKNSRQGNTWQSRQRMCKCRSDAVQQYPRMGDHHHICMIPGGVPQPNTGFFSTRRRARPLWVTSKACLFWRCAAPHRCKIVADAT